MIHVSLPLLAHFSRRLVARSVSDDSLIFGDFEDPNFYWTRNRDRAAITDLFVPEPKRRSSDVAKDAVASR